MPLHQHAIMKQEIQWSRGNYPFQNIHLWKVLYFCSGCDNICHVTAYKYGTEIQSRWWKAVGSLSDYFGRTPQLGKKVKKLLPDTKSTPVSSWRAPTSTDDRETCHVSLSHSKGTQSGETRLLSDNNTNIYRHVFLSHKVKGNLELLWAGVGLKREHFQ